MTYQDFLVSVEMVVLLLIWWDGRVMKKAALNSEELQRQSLEAQKQYLDLRRRWYEQRSKKKDEKSVKENDKAVLGPSVSDSTNSQ